MANLQNALELTTLLLKEKGLYEQGWRVTTTRGKQTAGWCNYRKKQIGLSAYVIPAHTEDATFDTITHEVAHAIAGKRAGHGWEWKRIHQELGGNAKRTYGKESFIDGREPDHLKRAPRSEAPYVGTCPNGHEYNRFRIPRREREQSCSKCCPRFNRDYLITWKRRDVVKFNSIFG